MGSGIIACLNHSLSIPLSADVSALGDAVGVAVPRAEVDAVVEAAARAVLSIGELLLGRLEEQIEIHDSKICWALGGA